MNRVLALAGLVGLSACRPTGGSAEAALPLGDCPAESPPWTFAPTADDAIAYLLQSSCGQPGSHSWMGEFSWYNFTGNFLEGVNHVEANVYRDGDLALTLTTAPAGAGAYTWHDTIDPLVATDYTRPLSWEQVQDGIRAAYAGGEFGVHWVCHQIGERVARSWGIRNNEVLNRSVFSAEQVTLIASVAQFLGRSEPALDPATWLYGEVGRAGTVELPEFTLGLWPPQFSIEWVSPCEEFGFSCGSAPSAPSPFPTFD